MSDTAEWVTEGARVAEFRWNRTTPSVRFATVERLTATQIVLDNGRRYRRTDLRQVGEDRDAWSGWTELRSADDGRVRDVVAREHLARLRYAVDEVCREQHSTVEDVAGALGLIEKALKAARDAIKEES